MARVFADIDISVDGFVAGPNTSASNPLGDGGERLIWYGDDVNAADADLASSYQAVDAAVLEESAAREGAVIMGRRTFDVSIDAWGETPPIHKPCFVLTSRPEPMITRSGGTTFTFVTDPVSALRQAGAAAAGRDVGIMGGAETIRLYLREALIDELHLHVVPVLLGAGTRLFEGSVADYPAISTLRVRHGATAAHLLYGIVRSGPG
jgi:dihydrofolate reductase